MYLLSIYSKISFILFLYFTSLSPQKDKHWSKGSVGTSCFLKCMFPTTSPCVLQEGDPLWSAHIIGEHRAQPLPLGMHPHVTLIYSFCGCLYLMTKQRNDFFCWFKNDHYNSTQNIFVLTIGESMWMQHFGGWMKITKKRHFSV